MSTLTTAALLAGACFAAYLVLGNLWHRVLAPLPPPDPATFPRAGDRFGSAAEGVVQEVLDVRDGWVVGRSRVAPGAAGPPMHVHKRFPETFSPERGTLRLHLADRVVDLRAGESLTVPAGVPHRFSNPGREEAVLVSDGPAMPQAFAAMLVQLYRVRDERGTHPLTMLLQMSVVDPAFDTRLAGVPRPAAAAMRAALGPMARLLGFRNYYPEYALHAGGITARRARTTSSSNVMVR